MESSLNRWADIPTQILNGAPKMAIILIRNLKYLFVFCEFVSV
jgi:hypothetical protein